MLKLTITGCSSASSPAILFSNGGKLYLSVHHIWSLQWHSDVFHPLPEEWISQKQP
jgi:hypothetical protein